MHEFVINHHPNTNWTIMNFISVVLWLQLFALTLNPLTCKCIASLCTQRKRCWFRRYWELIVHCYLNSMSLHYFDNVMYTIVELNAEMISVSMLQTAVCTVSNNMKVMNHHETGCSWETSRVLVMSLLSATMTMKSDVLSNICGRNNA